MEKDTRQQQAQKQAQGTRQQQAQEEQSSDDWMFVPDEVRVDARHAAYGGVLAAVVMLAGAWMVGSVSGAEAHVLLKTSLPSTRAFCGTMTLALGNILALMLTLLSLSASTDIDLKWAHYQRVKQIAWVVTVALIGSILVYLLLNVPLGESSSGAAEKSTWFAAIYYTTLVLASLLGGALITIALMLYNTVRDVIRAISSKKSSRLVRSEENESE